MMSKGGFLVVGYYTKNSIYEDAAEILIKSMLKYKIPYYVEGIEDKGDWWKNTQFKPTFLIRMLKAFPDKNIVYVDCDAEFLKYPELFDTFEGDIGAYLFDRSCYTKSAGGYEVLSGTLFFRNNDFVKKILDEWEHECLKHLHVWDQKSLERVLKGRFKKLPGEYCKIFDRMDSVTDPVIIHYQASRKINKKGAMNRQNRKVRRTN